MEQPSKSIDVDKYSKFYTAIDRLNEFAETLENFHKRILNNNNAPTLTGKASEVPLNTEVPSLATLLHSGPEQIHAAISDMTATLDNMKEILF